MVPLKPLDALRHGMLLSYHKFLFVGKCEAMLPIRLRLRYADEPYIRYAALLAVGRSIVSERYAVGHLTFPAASSHFADF